MENIQLSLFGKMSPEPYPATKARISGRSSRSSRAVPSQGPLCLDLRAGSGGLLGASWETGGALLGGYTTRSFGECPSADVVSRLSWILEDIVHPKYFLSVKACRGVLARAAGRGKPLPDVLYRALTYQTEHLPEILAWAQKAWERRAC